MCGIIGYVGHKNALPILLDGLKRLEYRGYDSAGIGILANNRIAICKRKGKIQELIYNVEKSHLRPSTIGLAHNRWATHGAPSNKNAHPHCDCSGKIVLVHNGIIENYMQLKNRLLKEGHRFCSDTDTEAVVHLIEKHYKGNLEAAVIKALAQVEGSFALGVICKDEPEKIVAARKESPLIIGLGKGENFIASDVPAILNKTREVIYLDNGEVAAITKDNVNIFNLKGRRVNKKSSKISFDLSTAEKEGFPHFMLKEIHQQPEVLEDMLKRRITKHGQIKLEGLNLSALELKKIQNIIIIACGTAFHAGLVGKYIIEELARIPVWTDLSSEFRYRTPIINQHTLVIAISQSGETADTLAAVKEAKKRGAKIVSICNVVGSSLARESDGVLYTYAGPEIGVASTKAYTAQVMMLYLVALYLSRVKTTSNIKRYSNLISLLKKIPHSQKAIIKDKRAIHRIANRHSNFGCFLYLGRNINFPSALEGALKLKEISYIPAEGYAAGEMKHGPIALIDEYRAVVCIAVDSKIYDKMMSNIQEIRARKGKIIAVASAGNQEIKQYAHDVIYVPKTDELLSPLLVILPLQLLAYYIATKRGADVDQPRNLAKSVTVE